MIRALFGRFITLLEHSLWSKVDARSNETSSTYWMCVLSVPHLTVVIVTAAEGVGVTSRVAV